MLLETHFSTFTNGYNHRRPAKVTPCQVTLKPRATPVYVPARRFYGEKATWIKKELDLLVENGCLEWIGASPWGNPLNAVSKGNGFRMAVDYRPSNQRIVPQHFPIPRIEDLKSLVKPGEHFTVLDLAGAFWSIPVEEKSRDIFVISTQFGNLRSSRLPQGFSNSTAIYQAAITEVLGSMIRQSPGMKEQ